VAAKIQADMVPTNFEDFNRREFDIYATMTPAKEVGGDFYDFFFVDENHVALVMADVSGKGVPAALFMMISKTLIKSAAQTGLQPKEIFEKVNNQLCENNEAEMFVTSWIGILEISTGKMKCANAGHEYPAVRKKNGPFGLFKDRHGFVLAGMENSRYREYELDLEPGDAVFVYTDGVAEATDGSQELYGTDRMIGALNRKPDVSCKELLELVHRDVDSFVGEAPQFDDITMLCLEYRGV
jgi:sigma-B regulation protein RsbU (phosphoserine phosphatase)